MSPPFSSETKIGVRSKSCVLHPPFSSETNQGPSEAAAPKLAAILLRCAQGNEGQLWLQQTARGSDSKSNAGVLVTNCLQSSTHAAIRKAVSATLSRILRFTDGDNNGVVFAYSNNLIVPLVRASVSDDKEVWL